MDRLDKNTPIVTEEPVNVTNGEQNDQNPQRIFPRILPLTTLEQKGYILVYKFKYLKMEWIKVFKKLGNFCWIVFLFVSIVYFNFTITKIVQDDTTEFDSEQLRKIIRLGIAGVYIVIAAAQIFCEPIANRVHQKALELFYPMIAERRARVLILQIK